MEFNLASLATGATIPVVVMGAWYYWNKWFGAKTPTAVPKEEKEDPKYISNVKKKIREMDSTKLKSLQPANRAKLPGTNWKSEEVEVDGVKQLQWKPTPPLKGEFQWKFYGSQLAIGEKIVFAGLPKKMHLLEITGKDEIYLDGEPKQIHPGELESLKRTIREAQV